MGKNWFSLEWFSWSTLTSFDWSKPYLFYLLFALPVVFFVRILIQRRSRQVLKLVSFKNKFPVGLTPFFRLIAPIFSTLALVSTIIALARPQLSSISQNQLAKGIDIVLAIDISESMLNNDILPNRLEAAKKISKDFIKTRNNDRIGLVVFAGDAFSLSPITTDYEALYDYIDQINTKMIAATGTALGSALATVINKLKDSDSPTKIAILISDGENTAGQLDPLAAAQLSKVYGVKVYTIAMGKVALGSKKDTSINFSDFKTLSEIAKTASGISYTAKNSNELKVAFNKINNNEKINIEQGQIKEILDYYHVYLRWAILFYLLTFATKITFLGNILED